MRVIGGTLGGRRLVAAQGRDTRPTTDRVREALFSRLESRYGLSGARVLDVFAGTGALAIEALSRGAASAVCIENDRNALAALRRNLDALGLRDRVKVVAADFRDALAAEARGGASFEGVLLDPPYAQGMAAAGLALLDSLGLVAPTGWVVAEVGRRENAPERVGSLTRQREDVYGDTKLALYERPGQDGADSTGDTKLS
ncbi:MAG TPA: 16S rRNA (guanine(966)-N(2))-methyltransferase RsmD [Candidatus Limnocylindrales bacterium]|nr:16S rRNA (guanine(966)-N(2))-methyltransferase RsmD [Candidatus Limnocylindrales bacterium]